MNRAGACVVLFCSYIMFCSAMNYNDQVIQTYKESEFPNDNESQLREIVRYGTMAASSHNTQCWKFEIVNNKQEENGRIIVHPDFSRRCAVVDPDDHHLYCTLGCAVENMVIAARAHGYEPTVDQANPANGITISLKPSRSPKEETTALFKAIPHRHCSRTEYDGKPLSDNELELLRKAGTGDGVRLHLFTDDQSKNTILQHILEANTAQFSDTAFKKELKDWIRFGNGDALEQLDGLYSGSTGNPLVPRWLGYHIFDFVARADSENAKIIKQIQSSAGFAIFVSEKNDNDPMQHWVEAGRCYERFALLATSLGIRNAFLNQPVEVSNLRPKFAKALGLDEGAVRPDLVVRFGRGGSEMPRSLRRPLEEVLMEK